MEYNEHLCNCKIEKDSFKDQIAKLLAENARLKKELEGKRGNYKTSPGVGTNDHQLIQEIRFKDNIV
jgi:hypothetical protein